MLKKVIVIFCSLVFCLVAGAVSPAYADVECKKGDESTGGCTIIVDPGSPSPGPGPADPGGPQPGGGGKLPECYRIGSGGAASEVEIPCSDIDGYWSNQHQCYVHLMDPQPPAGDSLWQGHTEGAVYQCFKPWTGRGPTHFWSADQPAGKAAPIDPVQLARRAVGEMNLRGIDLGMAPDMEPGAMGTVRAPVWMWVAAPSESSFGPSVRSVSEGGVTVTATAQVASVVWNMGDGGVVTCTSAGTPYEAWRGVKPSPDCGYTYLHQGKFTITAQSYWVVNWKASTGQTGTINIDFASKSRTLEVGEIQTVNVRNR